MNISMVSFTFFQITPLSADEQRRRRFLFVLLLTLIPFLFAYGLVHYQNEGLSINVICNLLGILISVISLIALRYLQSLSSLFTLAVAYIYIALSYLLAVGGFNGMAYFWFYFFPLIVYFLFGTRNGLFWVFCSGLSLTSLVLFNLGSYDYPTDMAIRFCASYSLVCILAHGMEASHNRYYNELLAEKIALENANREIEALSSLLPICASCKKISDDHGDWHQMESYLHHHNGITFSHGLCPECNNDLHASLRQFRSENTP